MSPSLPKFAFLGAVLASGSLHAADPVAVRTAAPVPADAAGTLQTTGRTAPAQQAHLFSRATGTIAECRVDIGDRVKAGDILAVIEAPEIAHKIASAKAKVAQMKSRADLAQALLGRAESLAKTNAVSAETLDERASATKTAQADQLVAEAELHELEVMQDFLTIRAPFQGTITARRIDKGDHVNGDSSAADSWLFHIARLNELRMVLHVPPSSALQIKREDAAEVQFADIPGKVFNGKVSRSSGLIDSQSGTMQVELLLPNADFALPAGLSGTARVKAQSVASILMIPSNAIATRDGVTNVAVVEDGKVKFQAIRAGRTLGPRIEVLSGLTTDREVIVSPNSLLRDGDAVTTTPMATAKKGS